MFVEVIDAIGKPTSGILQGSLSWIGEFDECSNVTLEDWKGKHCMISKPQYVGVGASSLIVRIIFLQY